MKTTTLALLGALCSLTIAPAAYAQTGQEAARTPTPGQDDLHYEFEDDDLLANAFGSQGDWLRLRPGPVRTLLIRPRTQFIAEMLESVEHL